MNTFTLSAKECPECLGNRTRVYEYQDRDGYHTEDRDCETCNGEGVVTIQVHSCGREEAECKCYSEQVQAA